MCVCGAEGGPHRRCCPLSYRNRRTGRTLFPATSSAGPSASPIATGGNVTPPPSRAEMKVGDYVCIHSGNMGNRHLACRIVGVHTGRYQLYCSTGILTTSFCANELTPLASASPI